MKKMFFLMILMLGLQASGWAHCAKAGEGAGEIPSLEEKFWMKTGFLLSHKMLLQLSQEQIALLEEKVVEVKKAMVQAQTQAKLTDLDVYQELHAGEPDVEKMKTFVDKEVESERSLGYALVNGLATAKKVLTPEQKANVKKLFHGPRG